MIAGHEPFLRSGRQHRVQALRVRARGLSTDHRMDPPLRVRHSSELRREAPVRRSRLRQRIESARWSVGCAAAGRVGLDAKPVPSLRVPPQVMV